MTHNSRCASARSSNCRCSCGGSLHGTGGFSRSSQGSSSMLSTTARSVVVGAGIGFTATVFPVVVPIYKAYTIAKIGKEIYDAYEKSKDREKTFDKLILESAKYGASEVSEKVSENQASQIARGIKIAAESVGLISQIARETKIDESVYGSMLEGSVKNGVLSGIGNLTNYTIEGLIG